MLRWADGFDIEPNVTDKGVPATILRVLAATDIEQTEHGLLFGLGPVERRFYLEDSGGVRVIKGDDKPRMLASGLPAFLRNLSVVQSDKAFEGCPTIDEILDANVGGSVASEAPEIYGSRGPDLTEPSRKLRSHLAGLPEWLLEILRARNGGHLTGVPLPGPDDGDEVTLLFPVGGRHGALTEATSLKSALVHQGLDERLTPFASTLLNRMLLVEAGEDHVLVVDDEAELKTASPLEHGDVVAATIQRAVWNDAG